MPGKGKRRALVAMGAYSEVIRTRLYASQYPQHHIQRREASSDVMRAESGEIVEVYRTNQQSYSLATIQATI
jgi:hypothetical protein